jgi:hypothetical protein
MNKRVVFGLPLNPAPILERVAESCDGSERRWIDPPGKIYAEELEWAEKFRELDRRFEQLMRGTGMADQTAKEFAA